MNEEQKRRASNLENVLNLLRNRGPKGATNAELNEICFRYGARIFELRLQGHTILTEREDGGLFRFILKSPVAPVQEELFRMEEAHG